LIKALKLFIIGLHTILLSIAALISFFLDRSFKTYHLLTKIFSSGVLYISGVKVKIYGLENIDPKATYVFVSNHASHFDIAVLQWSIPNQLAMIFKKELLKIPIFGWQLKLGPYIMVDRKSPESGMRSIEEAKELMKTKSISVLVFPEGTRSRTGELLPFKRGAFHLAAKVGFPIVPVTIIDSDKIMPKGTFKLKRGVIKLIFDKPINTDHIRSKADELQLMDNIKTIIQNNKVEYNER
jgi:1-acyl-sn-glycerol-3-phosphate acyltransferase